ncbi:MAG TPA: hypothetical protein K8U81_03045 [Phocaeicola coprocola]|jgi:hypothetical protein|uniref:Uncharacterized protein n=1 Tax=Phocaeicola coprocola TaxID=310298 RepID=A0A921FDJ0_9BACT|nr:hypothetical protein [Phocaeicola coprocola]
MKKSIFFKMVFFIATAIMSLPIYAENWHSSFSSFSYEGMHYKKNRIAIDLGVGGAKGGGGFDLGVRYQRNFAPFLGWDAISVKAAFPTKNTFDENPNLQIMTGVRGTTPNFFKDMSGYLSIALGYGFSTDSSAMNNDGGVCFEIGPGINLCKNIYVGYAFNLQKINVSIDGQNVSSNGKLHYFRLGFVF